MMAGGEFGRGTGELFPGDAKQWFLPYYLDVGLGNYSNVNANMLCS